jgi:hypothetical protein
MSIPIEATTSKTERRRAPRRRVLKAGKVIFGRLTGSAIDCTILDVSDIGAKLRAGVFDVPDTFRLLVVSEGVAIPVKRVWQDGDFIGVYFVGDKRRILLARK